MHSDELNFQNIVTNDKYKTYQGTGRHLKTFEFLSDLWCDIKIYI